jgi:hypothetical protein
VALRSVCAGLCLVVSVALPGPAFADETDNFTCRLRVLRDSLSALDAIMNARIQSTLARVNPRRDRCDETCLARELQADIGAAYRHPMTGIPHSRFERWIGERTDVDRCRVAFGDSIYGARPYNQPWLFPFTGRIILVADSIRVNGHLIGIDKINHFIREGLSHWKAVRETDGNIAAVMRKELGRPGRQFRWNEYGLKGWSLTGVLAYSDLGASYWGYRFWSDTLSMNQPTSLISRDAKTGQFVPRRSFTFEDYVNDSWDEGVNCSEFQPGLAKQVAAALAKRSMTCPATGASALSGLPDGRLYVNPKQLTSSR